MYSDEDGNIAIHTMIIICCIIMAATITTGGIVGGVSAGKCGENVCQGIVEGMIDGLYIGASIDLIFAGIFTSGLGLLSVLGSSMVSNGVSMLSDFIEVGSLQYMKSKDEGLGFSKRINNCIRAMSANREYIHFDRTDLNPFIDKQICGKRLVSNITLLASYCAYFKNGMDFLAKKATGTGLFYSYISTGYEIYDSMKNIIKRDYKNSKWEFY